MAAGRSHRAVAGASGSAAELAPPWALPVALVALVVGALLAWLVWHATSLDPVDAWVMEWQERARTHAGRPAKLVSATLPGAVVLAMAAGAALAWRAGRPDALLLALTTAPATLAVEMLLKRLVHRRWDDGTALVFPSGHVAVATAAAITVVLVVRVVPAAPARIATVRLACGFILVIAAARLVQTVHSLTDVGGGMTTGLVMTLGAAAAITAWTRRAHRRAACLGSSTLDAAARSVQSRS